MTKVLDRIVDRFVELLIVAVVLLFLVPAIWAIAPPSQWKDLIMVIMTIGDVGAWVLSAFSFIRWLKNLF